MIVDRLGHGHCVRPHRRAGTRQARGVSVNQIDRVGVGTGTLTGRQGDHRVADGPLHHIGDTADADAVARGGRRGEEVHEEPGSVTDTDVHGHRGAVTDDHVGEVDRRVSETAGSMTVDRSGDGHRARGERHAGTG